MKNRKKAGIWLTLLVMALTLLSACGEKTPENVKLLQEKLALLRKEAVTEDIQWELGDTPAGEPGHAVFISVCDTTKRADVYTGTGTDLASAWDMAAERTENALYENGLQPVWVKADVTYVSQTISMEELSEAVYSSRQDFFRYGTAFDEAYDTALLEAEMNGAKIYEYENGGVDLDYLNSYLRKAGREPLAALPESVTVFQTFGWLCDEEMAVYMLDSSGLDYGRRKVETIDAAFAKERILQASDFLRRQIREDGRFVYGYYPRFGNEIENYNIVRHASTIWSLICRYRLEPDEALAEEIRRTIDYMLSQVVYENDETAYLYEAKDDEIKLGGCGVAVVALTEYMDAFGNRDYMELCRHLGNGILSMLDQESGVYYHVLNGDFSTKEAFRTVYYDGEATFALCRLYGLTGEEKWLNAARAAVDYFLIADYTQYKDHWVAYSLNEITKYVTDRNDYYVFALHNVQDNLQEIYERDTTYHTYLELLMSGFELWERMLEQGFRVEGFDEERFLQTIYARADRMLNGFFFPEYAMYMAEPQQILNTFMVRHDGYRVRIDDVQHNIGGYYLYWKNYDRLTERGMLEHRA